MKIRRFLSVFFVTCLLCTLLTPQALALEDPDIRANVLDQIVRPQLADNIHAWELQADGSYVKQHPAEGEAVYDSQEEIGRVLNLMKRRK